MQSGAPDLRIILATKDNNISLLSSLIGEKADVNGQDSTNESALSWAAYSGFTECMQLLIQAKAKINEQHSYGFTPLFEATRWNKKDCLKILVAEKADVNVTSYNNETPLMRAARNGYLACVEILLEAKADIHHKNDKGDTALTNANYLCIGRLISAGALPGNTIKDSPASLLKEMENIDFRDKHTLVAIKKLLKYYKQSLTDEQLKQAEDHLQKRTELYDLHKTNVYQALDLGMEITMPIVLLDLIMEYHPITEINFNQDLFFFSKGENSSNDKAELKLRK